LRAGDIDGDTGVLACLLDGGDGGGLIGGGAGALDTRLHSGEKAGSLLAMALEVGDRRAAVGGEGGDEAAQLWGVSNDSRE
jgi:hypothetical protein